MVLRIVANRELRNNAYHYAADSPRGPFPSVPWFDLTSLFLRPDLPKAAPARAAEVKSAAPFARRERSHAQPAASRASMASTRLLSTASTPVGLQGSGLATGQGYGAPLRHGLPVLPEQLSLPSNASPGSEISCGECEGCKTPRLKMVARPLGRALLKR